MKANMAVVYFQDVFEDELYPNVFFKRKKLGRRKKKRLILIVLMLFVVDVDAVSQS